MRWASGAGTCSFGRTDRRYSWLNGVVVRIQGPEAGEIEIEGGLRAFYVPGRVDHHKGEAENRRVQFFLGFSYDGLRAWEVRDVG